MNESRVRLIHHLISQAVEEGLQNNEIKNRISLFARTGEEQRKGFDYLALIRTERVEELNILSRASNLSDFFRSPPQSTIEKGAPVPVEASPISKQSSGDHHWQDITRAAAAVRKRNGVAPTQTEVADELGVSDRTVRRWMHDLGMGRWPPPYSEP